MIGEFRAHHVLKRILENVRGAMRLGRLGFARSGRRIRWFRYTVRKLSHVSDT